MNNIGIVIKAYRTKLHMSRKELSANICSEKYLYMIEKGDRTPSSEITRLLGDKLGVDIFKYYDYLDCIAPIQVCSFVEKFNSYRRGNDYDLLLKVTDEALSLEDFHNDPWQYEIEINHLAIKIFAQNNYVESIPILTEMIGKMDCTKINSISLASLYVLLSSCYQMARNIDNARRMVALAIEAVSGKEHMSKYVPITVTVKINKITLHYLAGELDAVLKDAFDLIEYEKKMRYHGYFDHAFFYLAFSYYQTGQEEKGILWFHKALCMMLVNHNSTDIYYMMRYEIFDTMILDPRVSQRLIREFEKEYKLLINQHTAQAVCASAE